ncbi:uncharacterized protein LOC121860597 isoform X2 [Homarus americanus]|uniref:uncharacterized protein LOC121860597 isoform X2 n=1 Tax=Homarus americanus TaxID=6706 RepID=UPI001C4759C2|nr:uncharacterized protein LOC121860597 isoform X2 [Homarus americanus]
MLKFRVTNSTKARRAQAQRRALEEKQARNNKQLEWAWKPMAAMMNEDKTDLVYWIPPLYSSNLMAAGAPRRPSHAGLSRRPSFTGMPRRPSLSRSYTLAAAATERKRRLATRRTKMASEQLCDMKDCSEDMRGMKDEDAESGIGLHESMAHSREDLGRRSFQSIQEERIPELQRTPFAGRPKVRCTSMKLRPPEKVCEGMRRASDSAAMKSKTLPSLFRLLKPQSNQKNKHFVPKEVESRCYGSKKVKRPSIKVYNPPSRLSNRRARSSFSQSEDEDPCVYFSLDPKRRESFRRDSVRRDSVRRDSMRRESIRRESIRPGPTYEQQKPHQARRGSYANYANYMSGDTPKVRHAHLQMVLRLLAQMYEEKVVRQDTEIQHLKNRLQTQDKHLKRMVQMILHLKDEVNKIKNQRILMADAMKDVQNAVLSVKVGEQGKTGIDV